MLGACRVGAIAGALLVGDAARKTVPAYAARAYDLTMGCLLELHAFLATQVLGRATPAARRERERARSERLAAAERARAERDARRAREARRRWREELKARWWDPLARRAQEAWRWAWE